MTYTPTGLKKYADIVAPTRWVNPTYIGSSTNSGTAASPVTATNGSIRTVTLPTYQVGDTIVLCATQFANTMISFGLDSAGWTPYSPSTEGTLASPYRSWPVTTVQSSATATIYGSNGSYAFAAKKMTDTATTSVTWYGSSYLHVTAHVFRTTSWPALIPAIPAPMDISNSNKNAGVVVATGTTTPAFTSNGLVTGHQVMPVLCLISASSSGSSSHTWSITSSSGTPSEISRLYNSAYNSTHKLYYLLLDGAAAQSNSLGLSNTSGSNTTFEAACVVVSHGPPLAATNFSVVGEQFIDNISLINSSVDLLAYAITSGSSLSSGQVAPANSALVGPAYLKDESVSVYQLDSSATSMRAVVLGRPIT